MSLQAQFLLFLVPLSGAVTSVDVFTSGEGGSAAFRIPGLLAVPPGARDNGTSPAVLLAVAEGRLEGCGDFNGLHTIVAKRSLDGGRSWSALRTLLDPRVVYGVDSCPLNATDGGCEFWDPTPVFDNHTGDILLLATHSRTSSQRLSGRLDLWLLRSRDLGLTWATPENITQQVVTPEGVMTPGNGHGTQLASGRLLVAGYMRPGGDGSEFCVTIASDDHGMTWHMQQASRAAGMGTSECEVTELCLRVNSSNGGSNVCHAVVVMDERMNRDAQAARGGCGHGVPLCRWRSYSDDEGATWRALSPQPSLPDPACKGGITAWRGRGIDGGDAMLVSNAASTTSRTNITLHISLDGGITWPSAQARLVSSPGGYSDVQLVAGVHGRTDHAAILFEVNSCEGVRLALTNI